MDRHNVRSDKIDEIIEQLHGAINDNDLRKLLNVYKGYEFLGLDLVDKNGKTLLQHAAYKGNDEIVSYLLEKGADVNCTGNIKSLNTPLHLAAMRGKPVVCAILLIGGANRTLTNALGQTASQIAIEQKNNQCVSIINSYAPGKEKEPSFADEQSIGNVLPSTLVKPFIEFFVKFIITTNNHPVKVALYLPPVFLADDNALHIINVLNLMCKAEILKRNEGDEVVAFKCHYLANILTEIAKYNMITNKQLNLKEEFIKNIIKSESYLENFLEDCIRSFPFKDCKIHRWMVTSLNQGKDSMKALNIIQNMILNKPSVYSFGKALVCSTCAEPNASKICAKCKTVRYCNSQCQRIHWFAHKKECSSNHVVKDLNESAIERLNINKIDEKVSIPVKSINIKLEQSNVDTKKIDVEESPERIKNNTNLDIPSDLEKTNQTIQDMASDNGDKAFFQFLSSILKDVQKEKKQKIQAEIISNVISGIYKE